MWLTAPPDPRCAASQPSASHRRRDPGHDEGSSGGRRRRRRLGRSRENAYEERSLNDSPPRLRGPRRKSLSAVGPAVPAPRKTKFRRGGPQRTAEKETVSSQRIAAQRRWRPGAYVGVLAHRLVSWRTGWRQVLRRQEQGSGVGTRLFPESRTPNPESRTPFPWLTASFSTVYLSRVVSMPIGCRMGAIAVGTARRSRSGCGTPASRGESGGATAAFHVRDRDSRSWRDGARGPRSWTPAC